MSDEYSIDTNFKREANDPRAAAEYRYRARLARERADALLALQEEAAAQTQRRAALTEAADAAAELAARRRRARMALVETDAGCTLAPARSPLLPPPATAAAKARARELEQG